MTEKLTDREKVFALAYLANGFNATAAARAAGYKTERSPATATNVKNRPRVAAFIKAELERAFEAERMSAAEIVARLARIGRVDPRQFFNEDGTYKSITELDPAAAACIRGWEDELHLSDDGPTKITRKVKIADPVPALRTLAQVENLLDRESATVNIFIDLDARLDRARKRHAEITRSEDTGIVSEQ